MEEKETLNNNNQESQEVQEPKKQKNKKKRSGFANFLLKVFFVFITLIVVFFTATGLFLHFKFDVNIFSSIKHLTVLNIKVKEDKFPTYTFSEDDFNAVKTKVSGFADVEDVMLLSDKEISAIFENTLNNRQKNQTSLDGSQDENSSLIDYMQSVQVDFYNTSTSKVYDHLTDAKIIVIINLLDLKAFYKEQPLMDFMLNLIPNKLYISVDVSIYKDAEKTNNKDYEIIYNSIIINNLSAKDSESFIGTINNLLKLGTPESIALEVADTVFDSIIGNEETFGLYHSLMEKGAKCYSFYSDNENDYFIVYKNEADKQATITYNNLRKATNTNRSTFTVLDNIIKINNLSENGYRFLGWYDSDKADAQKVETICAWGLEDVSLFAKWEIIEYKIEYILRGGVLDSDKQNPTTYTVESVFTLNNPYKTADTPFLGWTGTNLNEPTINVTIQDCYGDLIFYARFEDDERSLLLYVGEERIGEVVVVINEPINKTEINNKANQYLSKNLPGYSIDKWYADSSLTSEYNFSSKVKDDLNLYVDVNYMVNTLKFYPYISKFETAVREKSITIDTREEFHAYFEYVSYYLVTEQVSIKFNYFEDASQLEYEIELARDAINWNMQPYYQFQYGVRGLTGMWRAQLSIAPSHWTNGSALKTFDAEKQFVNVQEDYALELKAPKTRPDDYNDFKINKITKTLKVKHSWQLAYCLEQGYRPICEPNSGAELMYNKAKDVLRDICDDSMNDVEKIRAMYEWLILNVNYDQKALSVAEQNESSSGTLYQYDSWQAEGVFNTGVAVCEGYAKAFLIMARIEGIPMIYVTGNMHAWNRVYLNGYWYGIDATQGDLQYSLSSGRGYEVLDNYNFLFTDSFKSSAGFTSTDYAEFKAEKVYNYYQNVKFTINDQTCDLHCNTKTEMYALIRAIKKYATTNGIQGYTFEFELSSGITEQDAVNAVCSVYLISSVVSSSNSTSGGYTCILFYIQ